MMRVGHINYGNTLGLNNYYANYNALFGLNNSLYGRDGNYIGSGGLYGLGGYSPFLNGVYGMGNYPVNIGTGNAYMPDSSYTFLNILNRVLSMENTQEDTAASNPTAGSNIYQTLLGTGVSQYANMMGALGGTLLQQQLLSMK